MILDASRPLVNGLEVAEMPVCRAGQPAAGGLGYLHLYEVTDLIHHAADGRRVLMDHGMVQAPQPQRLDDSPLVLRAADYASGPGNF